jgi:hypothetical protein
MSKSLLLAPYFLLAACAPAETCFEALAVKTCLGSRPERSALEGSVHDSASRIFNDTYGVHETPIPDLLGRTQMIEMERAEALAARISAAYALACTSAGGFEVYRVHGAYVSISPRHITFRPTNELCQ